MGAMFRQKVTLDAAGAAFATTAGRRDDAVSALLSRIWRERIPPGATAVQSPQDVVLLIYGQETRQAPQAAGCQSQAALEDIGARRENTRADPGRARR